MNWTLTFLHVYNGIYGFLMNLWLAWFFRNHDTTRPYRQYFLSDDYEFDESFESVPEDSVYIEEWIKDGETKKVVRYEGEPIPTEWDHTPFDLPTPPCPWVWVGDKETEVDLTRTFQKFLVPGNTILLDLVLKLIQVNERTRLIYIDALTFEEHEFPGDGITIDAA
jgi:hypothetical protein